MLSVVEKQISRRTFTKTALLAPLLISTWYTLALQRESLEIDLKVEFSRMADVREFGMRKPVRNLLPNLGKPVIDSVMKDPRVVSIRVNARVLRD